jgi:hypothetical protein
MNYKESSVSTTDNIADVTNLCRKIIKFAEKDFDHGRQEIDPVCKLRIEIKNNTPNSSYPGNICRI